MTTDTYDVIILGTGPAGLQAAIHAVRSNVSVLVLGKQHINRPIIETTLGSIPCRFALEV